MSATARGAVREELDGYGTPLPCALAICKRLLADKVVLQGGAILEPSVGKGPFAVAVDQVFRPETLVGVDLEHHPDLDAIAALNFVEGDFLAYEPEEYFDAVIGNPPYAQAEEHIRHAMGMLDPDSGVLAFLLRVNFLEGVDRVSGLWVEHPPDVVYVLNRRPSFKKTKKPMIDPHTREPVLHKRTGKPRYVTASNDACAYAVFVWRSPGARAAVPRIQWLEW